MKWDDAYLMMRNMQDRFSDKWTKAENDAFQTGLTAIKNQINRR